MSGNRALRYWPSVGVRMEDLRWTAPRPTLLIGVIRVVLELVVKADPMHLLEHVEAVTLDDNRSSTPTTNLLG